MKRELVRADIARRLTFFSAGEESELIRIRWCGDRGYCKINKYIYIYIVVISVIYLFYHMQSCSRIFPLHVSLSLIHSWFKDKL